ncbi:cupredoxin domain-containing protein [Paracidovorax sp. MALMAid1276]|uniref:cupredoxin domain-containing protein n=1 Tax=Paracidovorax sp. MALMAid1276 TaxID=3411631 RepID=UPI003B9D89C1
MNTIKFIAIFSLLVSAEAIFGHENSPHTPRSTPVVKEQKPWGIAGDAKAAARTIMLRMTDDMRFTPRHIEVREGETVRLRAENKGEVMHEIVIGTRAELDAHAALMKKHPGMEHDEPYMAHVAPGKRGDIVWQFNRPGQFDFACLIPGHYEAGMTGTITVLPRKP